MLAVQVRLPHYSILEKSGTDDKDHFPRSSIGKV